MLDSDTRAFLPEWRQTKEAQWQRFQGAIPGLQLVVRSGHQQQQYMLVCSREATEEGPPFYEGVLIGQLPQVVMERVRLSTGRVVREPMPEAKKPLRKRGIDLADQEVGQVIERWAAGRSAIDLAFIPCVWGRDGRPRTARTARNDG